MNARLKTLATRGGMNLSKLQALIDMLGGDESMVEQLLLNAEASEKSADAMGVAYKAAGPDVASLVEQLGTLVDQLRAALASPGIEQKIVEPRFEAGLIGGQKKKAATPRYDPWMTELHADQLGRPVTKEAPAPNAFMVELGGHPWGSAASPGDLFSETMKGAHDADPQVRQALMALFAQGRRG